MQDFYLNNQNCIDRLFEEWQRYQTLIVAYDYDNTVFDYHGRGLVFNDVVKLIRQCKELGFHLIVFTSSDSSRFPEIESYLREHDIPFDGINENARSIEYTGRNVYYNALLDDRAGLLSAYEQLQAVVYKITAVRSADDNMLQTF